MACGACGQKADPMPVTSGDIAGGRFYVTTDGDGVVEFDSYAKAREYQRAHGGLLRAR